MDLNERTCPLIATKPIAEFTPAEYKLYVQSFFVRPVLSGKQAIGFSFRISDKGSYVLTLRRKLKMITKGEFDKLCSAHELDEAKFVRYLSKRKISIVEDIIKTKEKTDGN